MADPSSSVRPSGEDSRFSRDRIEALLDTLEIMAAGELDRRVAISPAHDALDAIAYGINVLVSELSWASARAKEAQEERAAALQSAADSAERANAAKSMFLSNMSHEVRTPVAAMLGFADLLETDLSPQARADLVARLRDNGKAVLSILGDLLDMARLDVNKIELTPEVVAVADLIGEVVASVELDARAKGLKVCTEFAGASSATVRTDRYRLRQILVNLLANATKFTPQGRILISAGLSADDGYWVIDVADTGIGIAPDRVPYVFQPFEQADASIARDYGGVGLGLTLSRRLAEQLGGGLILLRSAPGEGTTFRLTVKSLPVADDPVPRPRAPSLAQKEGQIRGLRILLAEDHSDMQLAIRMLLEQAGASVDLARDGREAMARALASTFDVVVMDLRMPHVGGLDAARQLRAAGYAVPIVALTADPATVCRAEAIESGCDECLSKPFLARDLVTTIRFLHEQKRSS